MPTIAEIIERESFEKLHADVVERLTEDLSPGDRLPFEFAAMLQLDSPEDWKPGGDEHTETFNRFIANRADELLYEWTYRLENEVTFSENGRVRIWREMIVDKDWLEGEALTRPVGIYWAWGQEHAHAHNGEGHGDPAKMRVRLYGLAAVGDVYWNETVVLASVSEYTVGEEMEIRVHHDAKVEICGVEMAGFEGDFTAVEDCILIGRHLDAGEAPVTAPSP